MRTASASEACWQIMSSRCRSPPATPNSSPTSSLTPRRETRLRAVSVTIAARNLGPNAEAPIPTGNSAIVCPRQTGQRNRRVRCSIQQHTDRRQLTQLVAPEPAQRPTLILAELRCRNHDTPAGSARRSHRPDPPAPARDPRQDAPPGHQLCACRPPWPPTPSPSRAPPPAAADASSGDPTTAASNSSASRFSGAFLQSGRQDLNLRPPGPQPGALPDCATPRGRIGF